MHVARGSRVKEEKEREERERRERICLLKGVRRRSSRRAERRRRGWSSSYAGPQGQRHHGRRVTPYHCFHQSINAVRR